MKDQLEALILQMHKSGILYSEAVREFKKKFILTVLEENQGNQCRAARSAKRSAAAPTQHTTSYGDREEGRALDKIHSKTKRGSQSGCLFHFAASG